MTGLAFDLSPGGAVSLPSPDIFIPRPRIVVPPLRLPKWTHPWTRSKEDLVVAAIGTPVDLGHNNRTGNFNSVTLSGVTVAAGQKIIVFAGSGQSASTPTVTFSDSAGNTWTTDASNNGGGPVAYAGSCDVTNAITAGTITATWSLTVNTDYFIAAISVSGLATGLGTATPVLPASSGNTWNGATSGNITTTGTSEIAIGMAMRSASTTSTPSGSNTEIHDFNDGSRTMSSVYQIVSAGTVAPGGVWGSSGTWRGVALSYKIGGSTQTQTLTAVETTVTSIKKTIVKVLS